MNKALPSWDQISGGFDRLLIALFALAIGKGWITQTDAANYIAIILAVAAPLYGFWVNRQAALVKSVVNLANDPTSAVQGVITTNDEEGKKLAASIPGPVEMAGTDGAAQVAKVTA